MIEEVDLKDRMKDDSPSERVGCAACATGDEDAYQRDDYAMWAPVLRHIYVMKSNRMAKSRL